MTNMNRAGAFLAAMTLGAGLGLVPAHAETTVVVGYQQIVGPFIAAIAASLGRYSGPVAVKSRFTRSPAGASSLLRHVVRTPRRRLTPWIPATFMILATRFRLAWTPRSGSSACIRGEPYVPSLSS